MNELYDNDGLIGDLREINRDVLYRYEHVEKLGMQEEFKMYDRDYK